MLRKFIGNKELEQVKVLTNNVEHIYNASCAFLYLGFIPSSNSIENLNVVDSEGYIEVDNEFKTNIEGVFAAGDCLRKTLKQPINEMDTIHI